MPLQNRVTPEGEIVAVPERGTMMGNRGGAMHDADRVLSRRRWASRQWICCRLAFKGRKRRVMAPGRYTELFFLDEATALAAGHRPCFECRREDFLRFATLWADARGLPRRAAAAEMDLCLHGERVGRDGRKIVTRARLGELPAGAFFRHAGTAHIGTKHGARAWRSAGYGPVTTISPSTAVDVLTPPSIVAVLRLGYEPALHPSAAFPGGG